MTEQVEAVRQEAESPPVPEVVHKKFEIPTIDEVVQSIKELDEEIGHISLNLIKCNFNATQGDIRKTFPEYKFVKVKQYNPGSFEVVFPLRIDAIDFVKKAIGKKILGRIFLIKMGRNRKNDAEDWVFVEGSGNEKKRNNNRHRGGQTRQTRHPRHKDEEEVDHKVETPAQQQGHRQQRTHKREKPQNQQRQQNQPNAQKRDFTDKRHFQKRTFEGKTQHDRHREPRQQVHPQMPKVAKEPKEAQQPTQASEPVEYKPHGFHRGPTEQSKQAQSKNTNKAQQKILPQPVHSVAIQTVVKDKPKQSGETKESKEVKAPLEPKENPKTQTKQARQPKQTKHAAKSEWTKDNPKNEAKKQVKQQKKVADDDGWIVVGKKGR